MKYRNAKRNPVALAMRRRASKAGRHPDRKKRAEKRACRSRVTHD